MTGDVCRGCTGRCCRDVVVRVTGFDAWRIRRSQRLAYEQFVDVCIDEDPKPDSFRIGESACSLYLAKSARDPAACTFLMHLPDDVQRCGIYANRPRVCAVYPMRLRHGSIELRDDVRCAPDDWNMATLDYGAWRELFEDYVAERELFGGVVVTAWNAGAPVEDDAAARDRFFRYLDDVGAAFDRGLRGAALAKAATGALC